MFPVIQHTEHFTLVQYRCRWVRVHFWNFVSPALWPCKRRLPNSWGSTTPGRARRLVGCFTRGGAWHRQNQNQPTVKTHGGKLIACLIVWDSFSVSSKVCHVTLDLFRRHVSGGQPVQEGARLLLGYDVTWQRREGDGCQGYVGEAVQRLRVHERCRERRPSCRQAPGRRRYVRRRLSFYFFYMVVRAEGFSPRRRKQSDIYIWVTLLSSSLWQMPPTPCDTARPRH